MKDYRQHFNDFLHRVKSREHFTFTRFSDGELFVMQNKHLQIAQGRVRIGDKFEAGGHPPSDFKEFNPDTNPEIRDGLMDALRYKAPGYYKGIACRCCVGQEAFDWQLQVHGGDDDSLTWSNLLVNGNYTSFIDQMVPAFSTYDDIYIVCNKEAKIEDLPFVHKLKGAWDIGPNAMVCNRYLIGEIKTAVIKGGLSGALILLAASSLSNMIAYELHRYTGNANTVIDVGSTLNKYMGMPINRSYLEGYWLKQGKDADKICIW